MKSSSPLFLTFAVVLVSLVCLLVGASAVKPVVKSSTLLGNITDPNHDNLFHDGGYSGLISGHSVWLFADTSGPGFWDNYAAYGDVNKPLVLNGSVGHVALPYTTDEDNFNKYWCEAPRQKECGQIRYAIWPNSSPVQIATNEGALFSDRIYVNASNKKDEFANAGTAANKFSVSSTAYAQFSREGDAAFWSSKQPGFGGYATLDIGDGYIYLYGYAVPNLFLARVAPASIFDKTKYEFYKKGDWTSTVPLRNDSSSAVMYDYQGTATIFHSKYLNEYLMVFCQWDNVMYVKTAPEPWGPWSGKSTLYDVGKGPGGFTYSCAAHPEYSQAADELYVSYTWIGSKGYQNRVAKIVFE